MNQNIAPPKDLSPEAKKWWLALHGEFAIEDAAGRLLVDTAARAFDRMTAAREEITKSGMLVADRFGQPRPHPMLTVERDARTALMTALRGLHLEIDPPEAR
ncbi:unnamed protein product [Phaeothamnion confervicola]